MCLPGSPAPPAAESAGTVTYKVGLWCETFAVGPPFFKALRATSQADVDAALDGESILILVCGQ